MSINEHHSGHMMVLAKAGLNMKRIQLWSNDGKMNMSGIEIKIKWKVRGEGDVMIISVSDYHNCGGRKSIVSLKDPKMTMV